MKNVIITIFFILAALATCAYGTERLVPSLYPTIQSAIDDCNDGDVVIIAPGTYTGEGNRDIDFLGKAITVRSESGPDNCTIDCNGTEAESHRGFYFHNREDANSVVSGFNIINGYTKNDGGGIYCTGGRAGSVSPTIIDCIITANSSRGGIYCDRCSPEITNCTITDNSGSGVFCSYESSPAITGCTITDNSESGIFCGDESSPTIAGCTITDNSKEGIRFEGSSPAITGCTITGNSSDGIYCYVSEPDITNCTISGNNGFGIRCKNTTLSNSVLSFEVADCIISGNKSEGRSGGGGISVSDSLCLIYNSIISGNGNGRSERGGGISIESCNNVMVTDCTITGNSAGRDGGGGFYCRYSNATITNCIFWDNVSSGDGQQISLKHNDIASLSYNDIQAGRDGIYVEPEGTLNWGEGNIDTDPCSIQPGFWIDSNDPNIIVEPNDPNAVWLDGDYHLLPDSPCIDAGDPNYVPEPNETDLDGNPRIDNGRIDMGAYESIMHEARLQLWPPVLNRKGRQPKWITAWIYLPQGIAKEQVDKDTPLTLYPGCIKAARQFVFQNRGRFDRRTRIIAFFDKNELLDAIDTNGRVQLMVHGNLIEPGRFFFGSDTIRITPPPTKRPWWWRRHY